MVVNYVRSIGMNYRAKLVMCEVAAVENAGVTEEG